jgi:hypothetical protein
MTICQWLHIYEAVGPCSSTKLPTNFMSFVCIFDILLVPAERTGKPTRFIYMYSLNIYEERVIPLLAMWVIFLFSSCHLWFLSCYFLFVSSLIKSLSFQRIWDYSDMDITCVVISVSELSMCKFNFVLIYLYKTFALTRILAKPREVIPCTSLNIHKEIRVPV